MLSAALTNIRYLHPAPSIEYVQSRVVLDPYARAIYNGRRVFGQLGPNLPYESPGTLGYARNWPQAAAIVPSAVEPFDWEGDRPPGQDMKDLIIYEAHVRGFTAHASSKVDCPGTFSGLIERLDYLQALGITAIELMPVYEFNELEYYQVLPDGDSPGSGRFNFWGYSTVGFFSPMARYASTAKPASPSAAWAASVINEFKLLVREAHRRGIEVILDVVFNHTAEGNEMGPTLSFRGIDNRVFYMLAPGGEYYNYSGCGNTLNCNHPVVLRFIIDCLRYWVEEFHVDGFRFDLGSIMTRAHSTWHSTDSLDLLDMDLQKLGEENTDSDSDTETSSDAELHFACAAPFSNGAILDENGIMTNGAGFPTGAPLADPPLIAAISADPILAQTKLIAEAWDCDGLNQVGAFPHYGGRWSEWNGHFRDAVRQFIKGTDGAWAGAFASAMCGSPNIFVNEPGENDWWGTNAGRQWKGGRGPTASINFVTAHDGFTLNDLVTYNEKHNEANGEDNRDGESHNLSWNCGIEGPSDVLEINALRQRQVRNFTAALLLAHGTPMIVMGDEYGHTKLGNNNTYCHDSELNYFDWDAASQDVNGLKRFTQHMITIRKSHPELRRSTYITDMDINWHGITPGQPDWSESSRFIAYTLKKSNGGGLYIAFNTSHKPQLVQLPEWEGRIWQTVVNTGKSSPYDVLVADERLPADEIQAARAAEAWWMLQHALCLLPWSCAVLESIPIETQATMPSNRRFSSPLNKSNKSSTEVPRKRTTSRMSSSKKAVKVQ